MENISITDMMTTAAPVANVLNQDTSVLESLTESSVIPSYNKTIDNNVYSGSSQQGVQWTKAFGKLPEFTNIHRANVSAVMEQIAQNQSGWSLAGKALGRAVIGEFVGGTLSGFGALPKIPARFANSADAFERTWLEGIGDDIQKWANNTFDIYLTQKAQQGFALNDKTWWANMLPSTASALSILIPATMVARAASMLGRGANALRILNKVDKAIDVSKLSKSQRALYAAANSTEMATSTNKFATAFNATRAVEFNKAMMSSKSNFLFNIFTPAFVSRQIDSSRESIHQFENTYNEVMSALDGVNMSDDEKVKYAKDVAANSAHKGYLYSQANIMFDIVQWTQLSKLSRAISPDLKRNLGKALRRNESVNKLLGTEAVESLTKIPLSTTLKNIASAYGTQMVSEGFDEMTMDIAMKEGKYKTLLDKKLILNPSSLGDRLSDHFTTRSSWDSFAGGVLGGLLMTGGGQAINAIKTKLDKSHNEAMTNLANSIAGRMDNFIGDLKKYNAAKSNGNINDEIDIRTNMITNIVFESANDGTLDYYMEVLENIQHLSNDKVNQLNVDVADEFGSISKDDFNALKQDVEKIYEIQHNTNLAKEFSDPHTNRYYNTLIGRNRAENYLLKKAYDELAANDITNDTLKEQLEERLLLLEKDNAFTREFYNAYANLRQAESDILDQVSSMQGTLIANVKTAEKLNSIINDPSISEADALQYRMYLRSTEQSIDMLSKSIEELSKKHKEAQQKAKDYVINPDIKDEAAKSINFKDVAKAYDDYQNSLNSIEINDKEATIYSMSKRIAAKMAVNDENYKYMQTDDFKSNTADFVKTFIEKSKTAFIKDFENEIKDLKTKEDIDKVIKSKLQDEANNVAEMKIKMEAIRDAKLRNIARETDAANARTEFNAANNINTTGKTEDSATSTPTPPTRDVNKAFKNKNGVIIAVNTEVKYTGNGINTFKVTDIIENEDGSYSAILDNNKDTQVNIDELENISAPLTHTNFSKLVDDIVELSNDVLVQGQEMSIVTETGSVSRAYRASDLESNSDPNKGGNSTRQTKYGTDVDNIARYVFKQKFEGKSISKSELPTIEELPDNLIDFTIEYFSNIYDSFKEKGYTVIGRDIHVFDAESGIGGTLDLLLANEKNEIIILDAKMLTLGNKSFGSDTKMIKKYLGQVTTYASILYKQHSELHPNMSIKGVGFIVGEKTNKGANLEFIESVNNKRIAEIYNVPESSITVENGVVTMPFNTDILNDLILPERKGFKSKSVAMALNIHKEADSIFIRKDYLDTVERIIERLNNELDNNKNLSDNAKSTIYFLLQAYSGKITIDSLLNEHITIDNYKDVVEAHINNLINELGAKTFVTEKYNLFNAFKATNNLFMTNLAASIELQFAAITTNTSNNNSEVNSEIIEQNSNKELQFQTSIVETADRVINNLKNDIIEFKDSIELIRLIKQYKDLITEDSESRVTIDSIIEFMYISYKSQRPNVTIEELLDIVFTTTNTIIPIIKLQLENRSKLILNDYASVHDESYGELDTQTGQINLNGQPVEGWHTTPDMQEAVNILYNHFTSLRQLSNSLDTVHLREGITNSKLSFDKVTITELNKIVNDIDNRRSLKYRGLYAELNTTGENNTNNDESVIQLLDKVKTDQVVKLELLNNGSIGVYLSTLAKPQFIIPNTKEFVSGVRMANKDGYFIGFRDEFYNSIASLLNTKDVGNNQTAISKLKNLNEFRLLYNSLKDTKQKSAALNEIAAYINTLNNNPTNEVDIAIKSIIDKFDSLNTTETTSSELYNVDRLNEILNVLFYNRFLTDYSSYNPSSKDVIGRLKKFNSVAKESNRKYNRLMNHLNTTDIGTTRPYISKVYNPSIIINNSSSFDGNLLDNIVPFEMNNGVENKNGVHLITNVKGVAVHSETGRTVDMTTPINISEKDSKLFVAIKGVDGKIIPFPTKAATLAKSYNKVRNTDGSIIDTITSDKAIDVVSNKLIEVINQLLQSQVGGEGKLVSQLGHKLISDSGINNILIYNKSIRVGRISAEEYNRNRGLDTSDSSGYIDLNHSYLTVYQAENKVTKQIDTIVEFTTIDSSDGMPVETYHKLVFKTDDSGEVVPFYSSLARNNKYKDFASNFDTFKTSDGKAIKDFESIIRDNIGGALRQTPINKSGKLTFQTIDNNGTISDSDTFIDPISGIQYSSAYDYVLNTGSIYSRVDSVKETEEDDSRPITNLDVNGTAKLNVEVSVDNVTSFGEITTDQTENIENLVQLFRPEYQSVFDIMRYIETNLKNNGFMDGITEVFTKTKDDNVQAQVSFSNNVFKNMYSDNLLIHVDNKDINNSAFALLHEKIHKVILLAVNSSKYNNDSIESQTELNNIAKLNNQNIQKFITEFRKQFSIFTSDKNNMVNLVRELDMIYPDNLKDVANREEIMIESIKEQINFVISKIEANLSESETNRQAHFTNGNRIVGTDFAQELYTYYTNPFIMKVFSSVTTNGEFYTRNSENKETFIDKLVDFIINTFKGIVKLVSGNTIDFDSNFARSTRDMLSDLYYNLSNGISSENQIEEDMTIEDETVTNNETDNDILNLLNEFDLDSSVIPSTKEPFIDDAGNKLC